MAGREDRERRKRVGKGGRRNGEQRARSLLVGESWKERRDPGRYRGRPGPGVSTGRRFMWLLIESFSLDRAVYFLPSREISLRSVSLSLALLSSVFRALLCVSLFLSGVPANARGISMARVLKLKLALNRRSD